MSSHILPLLHTLLIIPCPQRRTRLEHWLLRMAARPGSGSLCRRSEARHQLQTLLFLRLHRDAVRRKRYRFESSRVLGPPESIQGEREGLHIQFCWRLFWQWGVGGYQGADERVHNALRVGARGEVQYMVLTRLVVLVSLALDFVGGFLMGLNE